MFKFGRTFIKLNNFYPVNQNGRIYPRLTTEEFQRAFAEAGARSRHGFGQWVIVSSRGFCLVPQFKFGRGFIITI